MKTLHCYDVRRFWLDVAEPDEPISVCYEGTVQPTGAELLEDVAELTASCPNAYRVHGYYMAEVTSCQADLARMLSDYFALDESVRAAAQWIHDHDSTLPNIRAKLQEANLPYIEAHGLRIEVLP